MKNPAKDNHRELPLIATAILSLALTLPLLANQTVAADDRHIDSEQTTPREFSREQRVNQLRFPAAGRFERSATVTWADLDLARAAGLDQLYLRLEQATSDVCSPRADIRNAAMNRDRRACLEAAMDQAVANVGHLGLEEMHASRTGRNVQPEQGFAER